MPPADAVRPTGRVRRERPNADGVCRQAGPRRLRKESADGRAFRTERYGRNSCFLRNFA